MEKYREREIYYLGRVLVISTLLWLKFHKIIIFFSGAKGEGCRRNNAGLKYFCYLCCVISKDRAVKSLSGSSFLRFTT